MTEREKYLARLEEAAKMSPEDLLMTYNGIIYPSALCDRELFKAMEAFEARDDDMLIATFPKCGTNWVIQILHEMVCIVKNKEAPLEQSWIEYGNVQSLEKLKIRPSPRIIASHLYFQNLPKSFFEKKVKTVLILRNPKDAAVSYYKFHNSLPALPNYESWDMFFKDYISGNVSYGSYFDFMSSWNSHIDDSHVLPVKFEDLKADLHSQLKRIAKFLGLSLAEEQISVVESRTSFTTMKGKSGDTHKKLADSFFRKGQVGDWKSLFTEEQSKAIDVKFEQNLAGTKLGSLIEYSKYCTF